MENKIKATVALLPGSYDPITLGHVDVIRRASALFDRVVVAVMTNDMRAYVADAKVKTYMFSMDERTDMASLACKELPNVTVLSSSARLIDLVDELGADVIVKGVRNGTDTDYELPQAYFNSQKYPQALTVFLPAEENKAQISSTLVRSSAQNCVDYRGLVPQKVYETMMKKQRGDF